MAIEERDLQLLLKALAFAARKHKDQRRKDVDASPYINHPISLANILITEAHVTDIAVICAALLHDTVEDTDTTPEELEREFGVAIRDLVMAVTDDKTLPPHVRKERQVAHVRRQCHVVGHGHDEVAYRHAEFALLFLRRSVRVLHRVVQQRGADHRYVRDVGLVDLDVRERNGVIDVRRGIDVLAPLILVLARGEGEGLQQQLQIALLDGHLSSLWLQYTGKRATVAPLSGLVARKHK